MASARGDLVGIGRDAHCGSRWRTKHMAKPTPKQLAERRRRKEAIKTTRDYIERFGTFACELTPATVSLMASSLKSGVDECASLRRASEERIKRLDEEHAAFLLQPLKAETERENTALIKT